MKRLFNQCPKCKSKDVRTGTTITKIRVWKGGKKTEDYQTTTGTGSTECLKCNYRQQTSAGNK